MDGTAPPSKHRGRSQKTSRYTRAQLQELRISRVHFRDQYLFCLLSDGNMVRVPLGIAASLAATPLHGVRSSCQLFADGKALAWSAGVRGMATERLTLAQILAHPDAQITALPRAPGLVVSRFGRELLTILLGMLTSAIPI
jgi:hypothetical protein